MLPFAAFAEPTLVADTPTAARSSDGRYISWREHIIDDPVVGGEPDLAGSDGLEMADLNGGRLRRHCVRTRVRYCL